MLYRGLSLNANALLVGLSNDYSKQDGQEIEVKVDNLRSQLRGSAPMASSSQLLTELEVFIGRSPILVASLMSIEKGWLFVGIQSTSPRKCVLSAIISRTALRKIGSEDPTVTALNQD